jgi:hypothetical protein
MGVLVGVALGMLIGVHRLCNFDAKVAQIFKLTKFFCVKLTQYFATG